MATNTAEVISNEVDVVTSPPGKHAQEPPKRSNREKVTQQWNYSIDSAFALASLTIGTGTAWELPALCTKYPGGIFIIQFIICYALLAVPIFYQEVAIGQYSSASPLHIFHNIVPAAGGLPAAMVFILALRVSTLSVWASHALTFFIVSFRGLGANGLPWLYCNATDIHCFDYNLNQCMNAAPNVTGNCAQYQAALLANRNSSARPTPMQRFALTHVYNDEPWLEGWISCVWVVSSLCLIWLSVGFTTVGGRRFFGVTSYLAVTWSFLLYMGIFTLGLSLKGSTDGLMELFSFRDLFSIFDYDAWSDAAMHAFFALNVGSGAVTQLSSMQKFSHHFDRTVIAVTIFTLVFYLLQLLSAFLFVFHLGEKIYPTESSASRLLLLTNDGTIVQTYFPEVISTVSNAGWFMCMLYFIGQLLINMQSMIIHLFVILSMIQERWTKSEPGKKSDPMRRRVHFITLGVCVSGLLATLPFVFPGGIVKTFLVERYTSYATLFTIFFHTVIITYVYGFKRFTVNIRAMIGGSGPINPFWWMSWLVLVPTATLCCIIVLLIEACQPSDFGLATTAWRMIGMMIVLITMVFVVVYILIMECRRRSANEPSSVLWRSRGEWGAWNSDDKERAVALERAMRVR